jgi:hypothetical protein
MLALEIQNGQHMSSTTEQSNLDRPLTDAEKTAFIKSAETAVLALLNRDDLAFNALMSPRSGGHTQSESLLLEIIPPEELEERGYCPQTNPGTLRRCVTLRSVWSPPNFEDLIDDLIDDDDDLALVYQAMMETWMTRKASQSCLLDSLKEMENDEEIGKFMLARIAAERTKVSENEGNK